MNPVRMAVLGIAAVCAIGLGAVVKIALAGKPAPQAAAHAAIQPKPTARVLTAARDLKVGDRLTEADLDWKAWPVEEVQADWTREDSSPAQAATPAPASGAAPASSAAPAPAVQGPTRQVSANGAVLNGMVRAMAGGPKQAFLGAVVRLPIQAGEPITLHKVVRAGESGYLAVVLGPGKRAATISVNVEAGAGGFVLPGDRVDVILTRKLDGGRSNTLFVSKTILRNMKVLAIDQTTQPDKEAAAVLGATATLEVESNEAETLAAAKAAGTLSLALRSYADVRAGRNGGLPQASFGGEGGAGGEAAHDGVKVFRYGQATEDSVSQ